MGKEVSRYEFANFFYLCFLFPPFPLLLYFQPHLCATKWSSMSCRAKCGHSLHKEHSGEDKYKARDI